MHGYPWDRDRTIETLLSDVPLPRMVTVRQRQSGKTIADVPGATRSALRRDEIAARVPPGAKIAVAVGSRGIADIDVVTGETIRVLKEWGAHPFIVPSMGSHGGATPHGQREVLAELGITEERMGVPIDDSMDVVPIATLEDGRQVFIAAAAAAADGIVVINRVKPHTAFRGIYESGLMKMLAIGLGKQAGAAACHAQGFRRMAENVPLFARAILANARILFGVALVENSQHQPTRITAVPAEKFEETEPALLEEARRQIARILIDPIDVMIVDEIGKNHSGDGMDPNVTGGYNTRYADGGPTVGMYVVLDASPETHGNTLGVGRADFTTRRLLEKTDFDTVYMNSLTSKVPGVAKMPMVLNTDRLAIQAAVQCCETDRYEEVRVVRIASSSHVEEIQVSENLLDEVSAHPDLEVISGPRAIPFDRDGRIAPEDPLVRTLDAVP